MSVNIDMDKVVAQTLADLGGQLAMTQLELNAQRAANAELEKQLAERDGDEKPRAVKAAS